MPKNVTNTGLRDTNLTGTLPYRLLWRSCKGP
jgi:hypothetical protein